MATRTIYGQRLGGWDVIAALLGLGVTLALQWAQPDSWHYKILWIGAPATAVVARRTFLPQLSQASDVAATPSTPLRRVAGYVLMIFGGFVMFIDGIFVWAAMSAKAPLPIAIALGIFATAGWIASLGYRRVA
jgi:hypothetical protein